MGLALRGWWRSGKSSAQTLWRQREASGPGIGPDLGTGGHAPGQLRWKTPESDPQSFTPKASPTFPNSRTDGIRLCSIPNPSGTKSFRLTADGAAVQLRDCCGSSLQCGRYSFAAGRVTGDTMDSAGGKTTLTAQQQGQGWKKRRP